MALIKRLWKAWQWGIGKSIAATMAAHGNSISVGLCQGYSAVLLPQLTQPDSVIPVSVDQASWIASLGVISNPVGAVLAGILMETMGRKTTIQAATLPYLVGWITIALSGTFFQLCVGRFISGLAVGMATASYVYVAEVADSGNRGFLSATGPIHVSLGVLLVYVLGAVWHWAHVAAICTLVAASSLVAMCFVPESPAWLVNRHRIEAARESLGWLRPDPNVVDAELRDLLQTTANSAASANTNHVKSLVCSRPQVLWKPLLILVVFFAFQEGSGIYIILYYAVNLSKEVGTVLNEYVASIVVALLRLAMSVVGAVLIKNVRRKTLAVVSGMGMALSMAVGGAYEHLFATLAHSERPFAWVPMACMLAHVCLSMVGFLQIPWLMTGELFPLRVRGLMGGLVSAIAHLFIFTSVKTFPDLQVALGLDGVLWFFAAAAATGALYCAAFLPETKGKTLLQIEQDFDKKHDDNLKGSKGSTDEDTERSKGFNVFIVDMSGFENTFKSRPERKP